MAQSPDAVRRIVLCSGSPRRRELLEGLGIQFSVDTDTTFIESPDSGIDAFEVPVAMAIGKSRCFHRPLCDDEILLTADTVVIVDGEVFGKPVDREDAVRMLRRLSGRTHQVVTGVVMRSADMEKVFTDRTDVTFKDLSEYEISRYVDDFRPYDKAGAYGVQEWIGYVGISRMEGSFYNVMGLPVHLVWSELKRFL